MTLLVLTSLMIVFLASIGSATSTCNLNVQMINQDPYPAVPGDYVKVVFQVTGAENPDCGMIKFNLAPEFPFSLDPGENSSFSVQAGSYAIDYSSSLTIPFKVRVDENAVQGSNQIKVMYATNTQTGVPVYLTANFSIEVGNTKSDFDIVMQDVTPQGTSFIITNAGKNTANSMILTVESEDVLVSGPKSVVIGTLNKGDFTIAHVRVVPQAGATNLSIRISYTDDSGNRIDLEKSVPIDSSSRIEKICWDSSEKPYLKWIFGFIGIFIGIEATILLRTLSRKKKAA